VVKINPKWLGFLIFVWLIGAFIGGTYEQDLAKELQGETGAKSTVEFLTTPAETNYEGIVGETKWWVASPKYWKAWMQVLTWDFPFTKAYDTNANGVIDTAEQHNNDIGVYAGYFLHAFGIVGLAALIFAMFELFQGFLPWG